MVLSNSSEDDSSSFSEAVPTSDNDPYSSSSQVARFPDVNKYPKAFQFPGSSPVATTKHLSQVIQLRLNRAATLLQRPPTDEEADALGYWAARQARIVSFAWPASFISGTYRAYTTRRTFKIPFYTPDHERWTNYINQIERGTGANAQLLRGMLHTSRWGLYVMVGNVVASVLLNSYAASVCTVGELGDKRLKAYMDAVKEAAQKEFAQRREGQKHKGPFSFPQDGAKNESGNDSPAWQSDDDASTTGGAYNDTYRSYGGGNGSVSSSQIEDQPPSRGTIAREPPTVPRPYHSQPQDDGKTDPFRMMEGSSENVDNSSSAASRSAETYSSGGSTWERIRQRAAGTQSSQPAKPASKSRNQATQAQQGSEYDSFSFSAAERDRQTARDEAQKEFDARVEQERRGGDFGSGGGSGGGGSQKRW